MSPFAQTITSLLSLATIAADIFCVLMVAILLTPLKKTDWGEETSRFFGQNAIMLTFIVCLTAIAASLFYSNIVGFAPCELCWWQRIFLYPQAVILAIAAFMDDEHVHKYSLALSAFGIIVSIYNVYLQFGGLDFVGCSVTGVSCQHVYFMDYGYVTIPTMALTAFALLLILMLFRRNARRSLLD